MEFGLNCLTCCWIILANLYMQSIVHGACTDGCDRSQFCTEGDFAGDPSDCTQYYQCLYSEWITQPCPPDLNYDQSICVCITSNSSCLTCPSTTPRTTLPPAPCPNVPDQCEDGKKYPDQSDCTSYYPCSAGVLGSKTTCNYENKPVNCPVGLACAFDIYLSECVVPDGTFDCDKRCVTPPLNDTGTTGTTSIESQTTLTTKQTSKYVSTVQSTILLHDTTLEETTTIQPSTVYTTSESQSTSQIYTTLSAISTEGETTTKSPIISSTIEDIDITTLVDIASTDVETYTSHKLSTDKTTSIYTTTVELIPTTTDDDETNPTKSDPPPTIRSSSEEAITTETYTSESTLISTKPHVSSTLAISTIESSTLPDASSSYGPITTPPLSTSRSDTLSPSTVLDTSEYDSSVATTQSGVEDYTTAWITESLGTETSETTAEEKQSTILFITTSDEKEITSSVGIDSTSYYSTSGHDSTTRLDKTTPTYLTSSPRGNEETSSVSSSLYKTTQLSDKPDTTFEQTTHNQEYDTTFKLTTKDPEYDTTFDQTTTKLEYDTTFEITSMEAKAKTSAIDSTPGLTTGYINSEKTTQQLEVSTTGIDVTSEFNTSQTDSTSSTVTVSTERTTSTVIAQTTAPQVEVSTTGIDVTSEFHTSKIDSASSTVTVSTETTTVIAQTTTPQDTGPDILLYCTVGLVATTAVLVMVLILCCCCKISSEQESKYNSSKALPSEELDKHTLVNNYIRSVSDYEETSSTPKYNYDQGWDRWRPRSICESGYDSTRTKSSMSFVVNPAYEKYFMNEDDYMDVYV